jgi:hypothetical protein
MAVAVTTASGVANTAALRLMLPNMRQSEKEVFTQAGFKQLQLWAFSCLWA